MSWRKRTLLQVIVTHEVEVAQRKTASRVIYMENGHIVEHGDAGCLPTPQTEAFKNYLSSLRFDNDNESSDCRANCRL